jgi:hypothetical protein
LLHIILAFILGPVSLQDFLNPTERFIDLLGEKKRKRKRQVIVVALPLS